MKSTFRLGRIAGIDVGVNWSWIVIFGVLVWVLSQRVFPDGGSTLSQNTYIAMAAVAAILFFVSLLAHELGHALVARREGMQIEGITLLFFGGVAKFRGLWPSAGAEFRVAAAGPLVSLAIAGGLIAFSEFVAVRPEVDPVLWWLGIINLFLLVFNLLPAYPLDGGRILRSTLWYFKGDFPWSTRIATTIGKGFGVLMIAGGAAMFAIQRDGFSGIWLVVIGFFLLQAATAEARHGTARRGLTGLQVRNLMTPNPVSVDSSSTIGEFMENIAWGRRFATYPVIECGSVIGLLVLQCAQQAPRQEWDSRSILSCMIPRENVPILSETDTADSALQKLAATRVDCCLVFAGDELVGLVSISDLAKAARSGGA